MEFESLIVVAYLSDNSKWHVSFMEVGNTVTYRVHRAELHTVHGYFMWILVLVCVYSLAERQ